MLKMIRQSVGFKSKRNVNNFAEHNVQVGGTMVEISSKKIASIRHILSEEEYKIIVDTFVIYFCDFFYMSYLRPYIYIVESSKLCGSLDTTVQ